MREADVREIWASHNHTPEQALKFSIENSVMALTIEDRGVPVGCFGIVPQSLLGTKATIWLLASDDIFDIKFRFLRHSKYFVNMFLEMYPYLYNWCHAENTKSLLWLGKLGAKINKPEPYGVAQEYFSYFCFEK